MASALDKKLMNTIDQLHENDDDDAVRASAAETSRFHSSVRSFASLLNAVSVLFDQNKKMLWMGMISLQKW